MAYELWAQDIFSKGELSPYMYARATVSEYNNGLKTAQNVLTYPTGAAGKRFGTIYNSTVTTITGFQDVYFETFQYLNESTYQLVFGPLTISIYLEGLLVATITTLFNANQVHSLSSTVLGSTFRVATFLSKPYDLTRSPNNPNPIVSVASNIFTVSGGALIVGVVLPVQFTTSGTLPTTTPQVVLGVTYFAYTLSATTMQLYTSSINAKAQLNPILLTNAGTSSNIVTENTWNFNPTIFKNVPAFDFNGNTTSYDSLTFTPSATTGAGVTITVSGSGYSLLNSSYVGGAFIGAGGTSRITAVASATSFTVAVQNPFDSTNPIQGSLAFLAEPAWSDARGWPQVCSSYQNRALFANTVSLPNGFWASTINDYTDFSDLTTDDDDAISWYPTSNNINYIRFIVPYRSLTIHTNTGIYSSPLSETVAITPSNFTLQLQDSTPADTLLPQAIDNQVLVLSGDDAHQMLWDGINNAYQSDIVSIVSEQTIRNPVDEAAFIDLHRAGSRYVFIVNANGSMAVFQTLISQNVAGFTPQILEQSYGDASFIQSASNAEGRAWFICQREIAEAGSPINITGSTSTTLQAIGSNISTTMPIAVQFVTTGVLPTSNPQIVADTYYWAVGVDANDFTLYLNQEDALFATNEIEFTNSGSATTVTIWNLNTICTLEELTQDVYLDCAVVFNNNGSPIDTITTGPLFNAQNVKMVGDGFGFDAIGNNNEVIFEAHGVLTPVDQGFIGFPINTIIQPMPLSISQGPSAKNTTLTKPKHIRSVRFMFNQTIGGFINGVPIALNRFDQTHIGEPPFPQMGIFEMMLMSGWDDFNNPTYTIFHNDPFNIELLGVFYSVEY